MKSTPMYRTHSSVTASMVCAGVLMLCTSMAHASHFRYGLLTWESLPTTSPTTVKFHLTNAFRRCGYSGTGSDGCPVTGDVISEDIGGTTLAAGDGAVIGGMAGSSFISYRVTAYDPAADWLIGVALDPVTGSEGIVHTYPTASNGGTHWIAGIASCCRISELVNAPGGSYRVETLIDLSTTARSPVSGLPPIVSCATNSLCTFKVPGATTVPNTGLSWRLANNAEDGGLVQPTGMSVNSNDGTVTWNTTGTTIGTLWAVQVVIESYQSGAFRTKVGVDFLISIVPPGNPPVINPNPDTGHPAVCSTTQPAQVGKAITFSVTASDPDPLDLVTLNVAGLPGSATMNPRLPVGPANSVSSTFSWTPTTADINRHIVNFFATDNRGSQILCPVTIDVVKANVIHPIVFVPGLMGSKLADGNSVERWPTGILVNADENFRSLALLAPDALGTTPLGVIGATSLLDLAQGNTPIYQAWIHRLDDEKSRGLKWAGVPYDWRHHPGQQAYVQESSGLNRRTSILSQLVIDAVNKEYAETQLSVLIVSHSMGNFLVKDALRRNPALASKVFGVVFVAAPQAGAATFASDVLHGEALSNLTSRTGISNEDIRLVTLTMPGVYSNGPTPKYFEFVQPSPQQLGVPAPITFGAESDRCLSDVKSPGFKSLCERYDGAIRTYDKYVDFVLNPTSRFGFVATADDVKNGRNLEEPALLNSDVFKSVEGFYGAIDDPSEWNPLGVNIYQLVGTNKETDCGRRYFEKKPFSSPTLDHEVIACPGKGDGTVIEKSAELSSAQATFPVQSVQTSYIDLGSCDYDHANIMESTTVQNRILDLAGVVVSNQTTDCPVKATAVPRTQRYIQISVYSPVRFAVTDSSGKVTGDYPDGNIREGIPGSRFRSFTGGRYIRLDADHNYRFDLSGIENGFAGLLVSLFEANGQRVDTVHYVAFPVIKNMHVSLSFADSSAFTQLPVDVDGNGGVDVVVLPNEHFDALAALQMIRELINSKITATGPKTALLAKVENALRALKAGNSAQVIAMMNVFQKQLDVFNPSPIDAGAKTSLRELSALVIKSLQQ